MHTDVGFQLSTHQGRPHLWPRPGVWGLGRDSVRERARRGSRPRGAEATGNQSQGRPTPARRCAPSARCLPNSRPRPARGSGSWRQCERRRARSCAPCYASARRARRSGPGLCHGAASSQLQASIPAAAPARRVGFARGLPGPSGGGEVLSSFLFVDRALCAHMRDSKTRAGLAGGRGHSLVCAA